MPQEVLNKKYEIESRSFLICFLLLAAVSMPIMANVFNNTNDDLLDLEEASQYEVLGKTFSLSNNNKNCAHESNLDGNTYQSLILPWTISTSSSYTYTIYGDWGGTWEDAEKIWFDDGEGNPGINWPGNEDDLMCWAATASNVLRWTGWGHGASADVIFLYFQYHWTDYAGNMRYAWDWWFDGTNPTQGEPGYTGSQVDRAGGGFWPNRNFYDYYTWSSSESNALPNIESFLRAGYGVGLSIAGDIAHAITCWGFDYDPSNPDKYVGIWVTDSDDTKHKILPKNVHKDWLRYYRVEKSGGRWYLQDYGGRDDRYISYVQGLGAGPGIAPKVNAGVDTQINEGGNYRFSGSYVNPGPYPTFKWDFGDGSIYTGSSQRPTHEYGDNGVYTVRLEVIDEHGDVGMDTLTVTVDNVAPTVNAGSDEIGFEGEPVSFSGSFFDPGFLDTHTIEWDFGDGSSVTGALTPEHIYADNGVYTVTLTVTDDDGGVGTDTLTMTVNNVAPTVNAGSDQMGDEGNVFSFTGTHFDPGILDTHTYVWDFGDGSMTVSGTTVTHIYADNGIYTVTLTVTDNDGGIGTDTLIVTVNNVAPTAEIISFNQTQFITLDDLTVIMLDIVYFNGTAYDPGSDDLTFTWDWGDNTMETTTSYINDPPIYPVEIYEISSHAFAEPGEFTVTFTVEDDDGGIGTTTLTFIVWGPQDLKRDAILDLGLTRVGIKRIDRYINCTIKFLERSLAERYWTDTTHINPKYGDLVFICELITELKLARILTDQAIYERIMRKLVKADELIARIALLDAENSPVKTERYQRKYICELAKAHEYLTKALEENEDYSKAIYYYWKSWSHAQNAIKFANKETCGCRRK
jgi:PKD repeat protein